MGHKPQPIAYNLIMPTSENRPYFAAQAQAAAAAEVVQQLRGRGLFKLYAFAVMPDHLELLLQPVANDDLRVVLYQLRLSVAQALRKRGEQQNLWAPRSEISKFFDPREAAARVLEIQASPVEAGLVPNPESYRFSSAHSDAEIDAIESAESGEPELVPLKHVAMAV